LKYLCSGVIGNSRDNCRFSSMKVKNILSDLSASVVVFVVALPLCLGVALASGAPLLSGVLAGVIGGVVVGLISGSHTSVSGPAAGLAAVVLSSIAAMGGFEAFLSAVVLAGVLQILLGLVGLGGIVKFIPESVIKGLLAAIGCILILKQIPQVLGLKDDVLDDLSFFQVNGKNTFSQLWSAFAEADAKIVFIGVVSLSVLIYWDTIKPARLAKVPVSLLVVLMGVGIQQGYHYFIPALSMPAEALVGMPDVSLESIANDWKFPSTADWLRPQVWLVAVTLAIIASLETLLNLEAVDQSDPEKRHSPPKRELLAQGAGNVLAGLLGAIPITSVIVRSSVNVQSGNATKWSAILHGVWLLLSAVFLSSWLNMIPLASLAAILIVTGYKLVSRDVFRDMWKSGRSQYVPFFTTIGIILFSDLLWGVAAGVLVHRYYRSVSPQV
jgi:carbonic anhydrase